MTEATSPRAGVLEPDRPVSRYQSPAPLSAGTADPVLIQMLEGLNSQNQLLVDLLAAVNGLTAALLCRQR